MKKWVRFLVYGLIAVVFIPAHLIAAESDPRSGVSFQPRIMAGYMSYEYEESILEFGDYMPIAGVGLTFSVGGFYLDGYAQTTVAEGNDALTTTGIDNYGDRYQTNWETSIDRQDFAATLGYAILDNVSIFAGYKMGRTTFNFSDTNISYIDSGLTATMKKADDWDLDTNGAFTGCAFGFGLGNGFLSFNLALAYLEAETNDVNVKYAATTNEGKTGEFDRNISGDTGSGIAYTLGAGWKAPLIGNLFYNISFGYYWYDFTKDDEGSKENIGTISAGLMYKF